MPSRMTASYEAAIRDPEILSVRREIAVHRAMADDLRRRIEEGAGTGRSVATTWRAFRRAHESGNPAHLATALREHDAAVQSSESDRALRLELRAEDDLVQKLARAENDRMEQLDQKVSREQALGYMRSLAVSVKEAVEAHVVDTLTRSAVLRAVSHRFEQLNDRRGPADVVDGRRPDVVGQRVVHPPADDGERAR